MSRDIGITLTLHMPSGVRRTDILRALLENGWSLDDAGLIRYLPLGDIEDFDWRSRPVSETVEVLAELCDKDQAGELLGITLLWRDTQVGGELLFAKDGAVTLTPSVNRRTLSGQVTDVSWYVERLMEGLRSVPDLVIEDWQWTEAC
jgi:hypothetical protein